MDLGACFPRELPPSMAAEFATRLEAGGADELWFIEDCFYTAGISLAATALALTERLRVGIGILPAVVRNPAITAMELATLARLAPGRIVGGIGHGVQEWMAQIGVRPDSPVTALSEVITAVRRLLAGEEVTMAGDYVTLDAVRLHAPPAVVPSILVGARGPRSLAMAGRTADGIVLAEMSGPSVVRAAIAKCAAPEPFRVAVFTALSIDDDRHEARRRAAPAIIEAVLADLHGLRATSFFDDLCSTIEHDGVEGLVAAPDDWWVELGAVGTPDDVAAHLTALAEAGADSVAFAPPPEPGAARRQLERVLADVIPR